MIISKIVLDSFAFAFVLFFLWTVLDGSHILILLLLVLQYIFVLLNQLLEFHIRRVVGILFDLASVHILQDQL